MSASAPSPVEATPSPVANTGRTMQPGTKLALLGIGSVALVAAVFLPGGSRNTPATTRPTGEERAGEIGQRFQQWDGATPAAAGASLPMGGATNTGPAMGTVRLRRAAPASIVGYQAPTNAGGQTAAGAAQAGTPKAVPGPSGDELAENVASAGAARRNTGTSRATVAGMQVLRAERLPQPHLWLMPGDKLLCNQNEPIVSIEGAPFTCVLTNDVKGRTGTVTLLDKYTRLVGTVVRGLDNGEERLGVAFSHAEGPSQHGEDPIVVPLNSPGADELGRAGVPGHVNTHFWSKLGGVAAYALLDLATQGLSVGVGSAIGSALGGGRNGSVNVLNLGSQGRSLAQSEFGQQANRRPTLERAQGEPMTVFITHPIDFRDAVALRLRDGTR